MGLFFNKKKWVRGELLFFLLKLNQYGKVFKRTDQKKEITGFTGCMKLHLKT